MFFVCSLRFALTNELIEFSFLSKLYTGHRVVLSYLFLDLSPGIAFCYFSTFPTPRIQTS